jgi:hypothetical protein
MNNLLKVALKVSRLTVPQLIIRGRQISDAIAANPGTFNSPEPSIAVVNSAINDLDLAYNDTADKAKSKFALMRDKKRTVLKLLIDLGNYVQHIADGDEEIVHLATLDVKAQPIPVRPDFEVFLPDDDGAVGLRCRARKKTFYRWEYCKDPLANNQWTVGNITEGTSSFIGGLDSSVMYWFRVILVSATGETTLGPTPIVTH